MHASSHGSSLFSFFNSDFNPDFPYHPSFHHISVLFSQDIGIFQNMQVFSYRYRNIISTYLAIKYNTF